MINNNINLGSIDITLDNISGKEDGKNFSVNGSISIGLSVNSQILNKFEPLITKSVEFARNKFVGKDRIQKALDECELLEIEVRKARLLKQLEQLRK